MGTDRSRCLGQTAGADAMTSVLRPGLILPTPAWSQGLCAHLWLQCLGCASAMDIPKVQPGVPCLVCGEAKLAKMGQLGNLPPRCTPDPTQIITVYIHIYTRRVWCGLHNHAGQSEYRGEFASPWQFLSAGKGVPPSSWDHFWTMTINKCS